LRKKTESNKNPHPEGWGYTDEARLRGLRKKTESNKNPHPEGWGYTGEACLCAVAQAAPNAG
ncbi:MAG: hypothetical protein ACRC8Y_19615, partial [Chroococcales cyanobacterium]